MQKIACANCDQCPLKDEPFVAPYVPDQIDLIVVGEAPGFQEVVNKKPFVGPSGKLLDHTLEFVGIDPKNVLRTNAVLCRPPQNNLSKYPGAITACQEALRATIDAHPDKSIVTLGASPLEALSASRGILKKRGQFIPLAHNPARSFLATLHPAFVLRSAGYMAQLLTDLRSLTVERTSRDWLKTPYKVVGEDLSLSAFGDWLDLHRYDLIVFDVETANLDPRSELLAVGFAASDKEAIIVPGNIVRQCPNAFSTIFSRGKWVAHNGKFDQQVLKHNGVDFFDLADDTMLMHYAIDEMKGTHGLKQLLTSFCGVPDYEAIYIDKHFKAADREVRDYSSIPRDALYQYLAIDVCGTLALHSILSGMIEADEVAQAYQIALDGSNALQKTEHWGIKIDREYLTKVHYHLVNAIGEARSNVQLDARDYVKTFIDKIRNDPNWINPDPDWIKGSKKFLTPKEQYLNVLNKILTAFNIGSWQQVQVMLYDVLALKHGKKLSYKTDPRSTNKEALDSLLAGYPNHLFVTVLQEFRRLDKIRSTYVEKLLDLADENDRVHIRFNIHGTETGRLSANDSLHGIPRPSDIWGEAIRGSFIAEKGYKLVIADYSQAELRCFAAESKEPFLLDAYNDDRDVHGETLKRLNTIFKSQVVDAYLWSDEKKDWVTPQIEGMTKDKIKNEWKELRTIAKNVNFGGLVYLGGASGVAGMIRAQTGRDIPEKTLKPILDTMLANIPTARKWQMDQFRKARDQGFVQSRFGNKRRFLLITEENLDEVKKAAVNAPIQNSASQLTLISAVELIRRGIKVLHLVHDSIICEAREDQADEVAKIVEEVMVKTGERYFSEVNWKADIEIEDRWYENRPAF